MEVFQGKKFFFASRWLRKKVYKKVTVADLAFYKKQNKTKQNKTKKQTTKSGTWVRHLNKILQLTNLPKFKCRKGCWRES